MQQLFPKRLREKVNWKLGRQVARLLGSAPGFLSLGVITATFKDEGITPEVRD